MSVFQVKLQNVAQGQMDIDPSTGVAFTTSKQRTIYATGPGRSYRKLADGETFTDSNYWKRFAYPQVPLDQAFINVVTDDGSVYSDVASENTYPRVWDVLVQQGSDFEDNVVDILTDTGTHAVFVQIENQGAVAVRVRLNASATAVFDLAAGDTQVFDQGDMSITKIEFINAVSGGAQADVQVIASLKVVNNS